jgi:hypothetical protein
MCEHKLGEVLRYRRERKEIILNYSAELLRHTILSSSIVVAFLYHHIHSVFLTNQKPKTIIIQYFGGVNILEKAVSFIVGLRVHPSFEQVASTLLELG